VRPATADSQLPTYGPLMDTATAPKANLLVYLLVYLLVTAAVALLVAIYYAPIWWVSLTAPNYPKETFPDGVRIHFHVNGVFNGCQKVEKQEIHEEEILDCVHEIDTINHYMGMYPLAAGGVIERTFSPFLISMLGVMLVGFMLPVPGLRVGVMATAFALLAVWMYLYYYGANGLKYQNRGYLETLVTGLDASAGAAEDAGLSPGQTLIAQLKQELAKSKAQATAVAARSEKQRYLDNLEATFREEQEHRGTQEFWTGSGRQLLAWHYAKSLGRYFNNPAEIVPMTARMDAAAQGVFWALIGAMLLLVWGARKNGSPLYWLLVLVPLGLPLFFLIDFSGWLWWYGHHLNEMGAFTVKPFMPTALGDGKVAQWTTHSYPYLGFGLMLVVSALLAVAALLRRREWKST